MTKRPFDDSQIFTTDGHEGEYQSITFSGTSAGATNAIKTRQVLLFATEDCHIRFAEAATAATITDTFLPGGLLVPFQIDVPKFISAIQNSTGGTLHISPVN